MRELLNKRLVVVTGKGGVGKSTVAAGLGVAAARSGRRTLNEYLHEQLPLGVIAALLGRPNAGRELTIRRQASDWVEVGNALCSGLKQPYARFIATYFVSRYSWSPSGPPSRP